MAAVEDVDQQAEAEPEHEAQPGDYSEPEHEAAAEDDRDQREPRDKRDSERALAIGLPAAQDDHSQRNQNEGKERADVGEVGGISDVHQAGGNSYGETSDP